MPKDTNGRFLDQKHQKTSEQTALHIRTTFSIVNWIKATLINAETSSHRQRAQQRRGAVVAQRKRKSGCGARGLGQQR